MNHQDANFEKKKFNFQQGIPSEMAACGAYGAAKQASDSLYIKRFSEKKHSRLISFRTYFSNFIDNTLSLTVYRVSL